MVSRMVVVVCWGGGGGMVGVGLGGVALDDPGVPFPQMVEVYGGATLYSGVWKVLCSVCAGWRLCQFVTQVSRNS